MEAHRRAVRQGPRRRPRTARRAHRDEGARDVSRADDVGLCARRGQARGGEVGAALTVRAQAAGIPILAGTDGFVGPDSVPLPYIHRELQLLVEAGLTPAAALATTTTVPARAMRRERTHGVIAAGRVADIVLLEGNPLADIRNTTRIRQVVLRGRPLPR
ncbi:MAG: amidohydrolase family protein [Gemmatimonadetes bacterium]|nr:amidohydrolase family protein [Gemmatimonadota bacterium]